MNIVIIFSHQICFDIRLLLVRNHLATDVMKYNAFELRDLVDPKRWYFNFGQICSFYHGGNVRFLFCSLMCKTSNLLGSMQKHVDVVEEGTEVREGSHN